MKNIIFILVSFIFIKASSAQQHGPDTLSMANYTQKASQLASRMSPVLTLRTTQTDSLNKIYQDYFLKLIQQKDKAMTMMTRSQTMQQYRNDRDGRIKKLLSPAQYKALVQYKQIDLQTRVHRMDSLMNKHR